MYLHHANHKKKVKFWSHSPNNILSIDKHRLTKWVLSGMKRSLCISTVRITGTIDENQTKYSLKHCFQQEHSLLSHNSTVGPADRIMPLQSWWNRMNVSGIMKKNPSLCSTSLFSGCNNNPCSTAVHRKFLSRRVWHQLHCYTNTEE